MVRCGTASIVNIIMMDTLSHKHTIAQLKCRAAGSQQTNQSVCLVAGCKTGGCFVFVVTDIEALYF